MKTNKSTGEILREKREEKSLFLRHVSAELDINTAILGEIEISETKNHKKNEI